MAPTDAPALSSLLADLYGGVEAARPWAPFLETLARWMSASYAVLIISAPEGPSPGTFVAPGADPQRSADYIDSFFAEDPFRGLPDGKVTSFADFMASRPGDCYRAYRDYLALAGGEQVIAVDLRFEGTFEARFRIMRIDALPDFSVADRARLQALVPHLRIAIALFAKMQLAGAQHGVFYSAAEGFGVAVLILDRSRRIVSSNLLAERFLAEGEGLRRSGEKIFFASRDVAATVGALLAGPADQDGIRRFLIPRSERGDLAATTRPITLPAIHSGAGSLALFLTDPDAREVPDDVLLRAMFGLTPAEAKLAARLARGNSLVDAARLGGISPNTAKSQLRAIFAKTGTRRQSQLAVKLAALGK